MSRGGRIGSGGSAEVFAWGEDAVLKLFRPRYAYAAPVRADLESIAAGESKGAILV